MESPNQSASDALSTARTNKNRKFPDQKDDRSRSGLIFPVVEPTFQIGPGETVFTIGSCFARNIEEELVKQGLRVPTNDFSAPSEEIAGAGRANQALNQYNPGTMLQCLEAIADGIPKGALYPAKDGQVTDALVSSRGIPVSAERADMRRREIHALYADDLPKANVTIITLGLTEAWFDAEEQLFLNINPSPALVKQHPDRFRFVELGYADIHRMVREIVTRIHAAGCPKILMTVSPVPLIATFSERDCVVANAASKAKLKIVADEVSREFDSVDYFPSYEIVTSGGLSAFDKSQRHVRADVVARVVDYMVDAYVLTDRAAEPRQSFGSRLRRLYQGIS